MKQIINKEYEEWQKYKAEKAKSPVAFCQVFFRIYLHFYNIGV